MSWSQFAQLQTKTIERKVILVNDINNFPLLCSDIIVNQTMISPRLSDDEHKWCINNPRKILHLQIDKIKFNYLQCDILQTASETCDSLWGDSYLKKWSNSVVKQSF